MTDTFPVRLDWHESNALLHALRHPRAKGSAAVLEAFAVKLGDARLGLARDAAERILQGGR